MRQIKRQNIIIILGILTVVFLIILWSFIKNTSLVFFRSIDREKTATTPRPYNVNPLVTNTPNYWPQGLSEPTITSISPQQGTRANAEIAIVEFSNIACPYCAGMHESLKNIFDKFPGKILWVWKDLPVTHLYKESRNAHAAARCAWKQNQFWPFVEKLFENQNGLNDSLYLQIANELNLNMSSFSSCLQKISDVNIFIDYDIEEARALGVTGTPYFFLITKNGDIKRLTGIVTEDKLLNIISSLLTFDKTNY